MKIVDAGLEYLPLDQLALAPENVRHSGPIDGLVKSIKQFGILTPLVGYRGEDDIVQIVNGGRRFRAAQQLWGKKGLKATRIPVRLIAKPTDGTGELISIVENVERQNLDPVQLADAYRLAMNQGLSMAQVAKRFDVTEKDVRKTAILSGLGTRARELYYAGTITLAGARMLAQFPEVSQDVALDAEVQHYDRFTDSGLRRRLFRVGFQAKFALFDVAKAKLVPQTDLFDESPDPMAYITDTEGFWRHQEKAIQKLLAERVKTAAWVAYCDMRKLNITHLSPNAFDRADPIAVEAAEEPDENTHLEEGYEDDEYDLEGYEDPDNATYPIAGYGTIVRVYDSGQVVIDDGLMPVPSRQDQLPGELAPGGWRVPFEDGSWFAPGIRAVLSGGRADTSVPAAARGGVVGGATLSSRAAERLGEIRSLQICHHLIGETMRNVLIALIAAAWAKAGWQRAGVLQLSKDFDPGAMLSADLAEFNAWRGSRFMPMPLRKIAELGDEALIRLAAFVTQQLTAGEITFADQLAELLGAEAENDWKVDEAWLLSRPRVELDGYCRTLFATDPGNFKKKTDTIAFLVKAFNRDGVTAKNRLPPALLYAHQRKEETPEKRDMAAELDDSIEADDDRAFERAVAAE